MKKMQAGRELTEAEEKALENWGQEMENKYGDETKSQPTKNAAVSSVNKTGTVAKLPSALPALSPESYVKLANSLMQGFGTKSGDLPGLNQLLAKTNKTTEGADYGALFMMEGAGAAGIYTCAWSAVKDPVDILTANNLAVALKNEGDYAKAIQVLKYANSVRPGIGLILSNTGWVYFDAGDYAKAKIEFNTALKAAPDMTSPYMGLGLIAQREGNTFKAREYLRKALKDRYSVAGIKAYRQAQQKASSDNLTTEDPFSGEKENSDDLQVPDIPVYEQPQKMAPQEPILRNYVSKLNSRLGRITREMEALSGHIRKQQERAMQDPGNAVVYRRDFSREMMMLEDIDLLLWGENGNYGRAVRQSSAFTENAGRIMEQNSTVMSSCLEKILELDEKLRPLYDQLEACKGDESCMKMVSKKMEPFLAEKEQVSYKLCKLGKQQMDVLFSGSYKSLSVLQAQFKETVPDYYAFTGPVLGKIYAPALNELYNLHREAKVLTEEVTLASRALGLAEDAGKYDELECIEPEPPAPPDAEIEEANAPKKKPEACPLGDGVQAGIGAFSFELTCTFVKVSGGEGVLASVKRDFVKHETTLWAGVGAKADYGHGNLTAEASVGAEITIGQNTVKDIGFTSSVKAGIGGLMETEISGRIAMDSGASIDMTTDFLP
ncbi:MAG: tetratricopeptide repeat protein [Mangrovibacterium sp.]